MFFWPGPLSYVCTNDNVVPYIFAPKEPEKRSQASFFDHLLHTHSMIIFLSQYFWKMNGENTASSNTVIHTW